MLLNNKFVKVILIVNIKKNIKMKKNEKISIKSVDIKSEMW